MKKKIKFRKSHYQRHIIQYQYLIFIRENIMDVSTRISYVAFCNVCILRLLKEENIHRPRKNTGINYRDVSYLVTLWSILDRQYRILWLTIYWSNLLIITSVSDRLFVCGTRVSVILLSESCHLRMTVSVLSSTRHAPSTAPSVLLPVTNRT